MRSPQLLEDDVATVSREIVTMTESPRSECRNCLSDKTIVKPNGVLASFFILRVIGRPQIFSIPLYESISSWIARINPRLLRAFFSAIFDIAKKTPVIASALGFSSPAYLRINTSIRICGDCGYVGPNVGYSEEQLASLYIDYRSDSYNHDRCSCEPNYAKIMHLVGKSEQELRLRMANVDSILASFCDINSVTKVLDWGGGDGRFIPSSLRDKYVRIVDSSNVPPIDPRYVSSRSVPLGEIYDYIQICHVLEHVCEPNRVLRDVVNHLRPGGYLYIEVPQDKSDSELLDFWTSTNPQSHLIHEHVGLYSVLALGALCKSLRLRQLYLESKRISLEYSDLTIVSGLFLNIPAAN